LPERAYISIGSNVDPARWLPLAVARLPEIGTILAVSGVYQSAAYGSEDHPDFLNAGAVLATSLAPMEIRERLRAIESALGRVRGEDKFAPRTIDLDLCLFGDRVMDDGVLVLPHPEVTEQAYVAGPLAEIDPTHRHPLTDESLAEIAVRLRATSELTERTDIKLVEGPDGDESR